MGDRLLRIVLGLVDMAMLGALSISLCLALVRVGCLPRWYNQQAPGLCSLGMDQPGDLLLLVVVSPFLAAAAIHGVCIGCSAESRDLRSVISHCVLWWLMILGLTVVMLFTGAALDRTTDERKTAGRDAADSITKGASVENHLRRSSRS